MKLNNQSWTRLNLRRGILNVVIGGRGFQVKAPWNDPPPSERFGACVPAWKFKGWRVFKLPRQIGAPYYLDAAVYFDGTPMFARRHLLEEAPGYVRDDYYGDWKESDTVFKARILEELRNDPSIVP